VLAGRKVGHVSRSRDGYPHGMRLGATAKMRENGMARRLVVR